MNAIFRNLLKILLILCAIFAMRGFYDRAMFSIELGSIEDTCKTFSRSPYWIFPFGIKDCASLAWAEMARRGYPVDISCTGYTLDTSCMRYAGDIESYKTAIIFLLAAAAVWLVDFILEKRKREERKKS